MKMTGKKKSKVRYEVEGVFICKEFGTYINMFFEDLGCDLDYQGEEETFAPRDYFCKPISLALPKEYML